MTRKSLSCFSAGFAFILVLLGVVASLSPAPLHGQSFFGSIVGTVMDTSGAAVPGATVTITNLGTNEKKDMQSDASGTYRFVNLLPAQYKLEIEKTNYKRYYRVTVSVLVVRPAALTYDWKSAHHRNRGSDHAGSAAADRIRNPRRAG